MRGQRVAPAGLTSAFGVRPGHRSPCPPQVGDFLAPFCAGKKPMMTMRLAAAALMVMAAACGGVGPTDCTRDTDCKGSRLCRNGACLDPTGAGGGTQQQAGTGGGTTQSGTQYGSCCLNDSYYSCSTKAAFDQCAGFDIGACHDGCGADFGCHMQCDTQAASTTHDPSACARDASHDNTCGTISGSCVGTRGVACSYSSQCSSNNCTDGHCYGTAVGNPCGYSSQCASNNCTNGCCSGNSTGSACSYSSQCNSNNCTNGRCQ